jgi:opacity protein-like surface antigen
MSRTHAVALFLTGAVATASPALTQEAPAARAFTLGVSGGLSIPSGDAGDVLKTGFNAGAHLAFTPAMLPFGVRVEGQFHRFDLKDQGFDQGGNLRILSGTVNGVFGVPAASSAFRPYLIGGVGVSNGKYGFDEPSDLADQLQESRTKFGVNGGVGIEFGLSGLATFVEARYHYIFDKAEDPESGESANTRFIPISFGIKF